MIDKVGDECKMKNRGIGIVFNRRHAQTAFVDFRDAAEIAAPAGCKRGASVPVRVLLDSRHRLRPMSKPGRFM